jgi:hypothetical protein
MQQHAMATGHVRIPGVGGGGHYGDIAARVGDTARAGGVSQSQILGVIRAPNTKAQSDALAALAVGKTPAQQAALAGFAGTAAQTGFLTQALEPARAPGMFAAAGVGQHVGGSASSVLGPSAAFGPMTGEGAARAASEEQRQRRAAGLTQMPGTQPKGLTAADQAAIDERHARVTQMFVRLRRVVARGEIEALAGSEAAAMRRIAQAFDTWMKRRTRSADPKRLRTAMGALETELTAWMRSFYG